MSKTIVARMTAAGAALTLLTTASAVAAEPAAIHGAKTVGALALETYGLATDNRSVSRQRGYALPGAVQWIATPTADERVKQAAAF